MILLKRGIRVILILRHFTIQQKHYNIKNDKLV